MIEIETIEIAGINKTEFTRCLVQSAEIMTERVYYGKCKHELLWHDKDRFDAKRGLHVLYRRYVRESALQDSIRGRNDYRQLTRKKALYKSITEYIHCLVQEICCVCSSSIKKQV